MLSRPIGVRAERTPRADLSSPRISFSPQAARVELTVQGRERVTLQKTHTLPESELAPFHHVQGVSHKEHHEYLVKYPKPAVRDLEIGRAHV